MSKRNIVKVVLSIFATRPAANGVRHFSISLMIRDQWAPEIVSITQDSDKEQVDAFLRTLSGVLCEACPAHQHIWSTWEWFFRRHWQSGVVQYRFEDGMGSWPNIEGFEGLEDRLIRDYLGE